MKPSSTLASVTLSATSSLTRMPLAYKNFQDSPVAEALGVGGAGLIKQQRHFLRVRISGTCFSLWRLTSSFTGDVQRGPDRII
jgi:hypothetical protein